MGNKSIFKDTRRPFLDQEAIKIPTPIKHPGECNLKANEWWYLLLISVEKSPDITEADFVSFINEMISDIGDRTTIWRIRRSLIKQGYLVEYKSANGK